MKQYPEFSHLKKIEDSGNPYCSLFMYESGECFYIEPLFYNQLMGFKDHYPLKFHLIIEAMELLVKKNKKIVFTGNYELPLTNVDNFLFLEINDVTDPLQIFVEDKSRGSDYGD